ncbi:hypothetical protein KVR01_008077 [Diaporthe batatas]|uniref:uncharacterized protein n=1 Tax=Diaporthe batatas TaxID=748121 RepID=UPI001D059CEC|nr:uncharacterized protein KVR01_008077 [Diaporthe batatas]KAG8162312.1 hypothetical protein KVR01_008077 [Diaporthe batatas]
MNAEINYAGFHGRLTRVQQLLHDRGLQVFNIMPMAFHPNNEPSTLNNFLFKAELAKPAMASNFPGTQPGTCKAPAEGVSVLVVKLNNPAAEDFINHSNRVANDVAAQKLVREYLADSNHRTMKQVVPSVYAWAPARTTNPADAAGFGWIISEFRSGVNLASVFGKFPFDEKKHALKQLKDILRAVRSAKLPEGVTKFGGGLTFDSEGQVVDGESPTEEIMEPASSYLEWLVGHTRAELDAASECRIIQRWQGSGVIARIEKFLNGGGPEKLLADLDIGRKGQALIHAGLNTGNLLWDLDKREITAVLDFEFAVVNHPFEEFDSLSFTDLGGSLEFDTAGPIREAVASGDFTKTPDADDIPPEKWMLAKEWNAVLDDLAPSKIKGLGGILDLLQLQFLLFQFRDSMEVISIRFGLANLTEELLPPAHAALVEWLEKHGF